MTVADFPNLEAGSVHMPTLSKLLASKPSTHRPRILLLYGSLRERSYSRFLTLEAERLLQHFGAETRVFDHRCRRFRPPRAGGELEGHLRRPQTSGPRATRLYLRLERPRFAAHQSIP